jgi:hypothetical protein
MNKDSDNYVYALSDSDFIIFHEERFAELSNDIIIKSENAIKEVLREKDIKEIQKAIEKSPIYWASQYHFNFGMKIRNLLRDKVCLDDALPSGNWDDYYAYLIECAVGMRTF